MNFVQLFLKKLNIGVVYAYPQFTNLSESFIKLFTQSKTYSFYKNSNFSLS